MPEVRTKVSILLVLVDRHFRKRRKEKEAKEIYKFAKLRAVQDQAETRGRVELQIHPWQD